MIPNIPTIENIQSVRENENIINCLTKENSLQELKTLSITLRKVMKDDNLTCDILEKIWDFLFVCAIFSLGLLLLIFLPIYSIVWKKAKELGCDFTDPSQVSNSSFMFLIDRTLRTI
jgi:hypothetical protein